AMTLTAGVRLLRRHLRPQRQALWRLAGWSALDAAPTVVSGLRIAHALDRGFLADRPLVGLGWLAALALLQVMGAVGTRQVYPWLAATVEPLRDSLLTAVVTASLHRALKDERAASGSSVSQASEQVEAVRMLYSTLVRTMRQLLSGGIAALGGLTVLSPSLALVVASFVFLAVILFAGILRIMVGRFRTVVLRAEEVSATAAPVVEGMRDVVAHAAEARAAREVGAAIQAQAEALRAFARARVLRLPVVTLGVHLPMLALLAMSPWLIARHNLTVGQIVGCVVYLASGLQPAFQVLVNAGGTLLVSLGVILGRLAEVCVRAEPPASAAHLPALRPASHDLDLDGVTFAYSPHAEPLVADLTLHVPAGMHLAVVGPSGVGKSTLANLLARLVAPQRGQLRLGGLALEQVDEGYLRRTVALIPQEAYVFAGSIRDNLAYLRPEATSAEIDEAVVAVGLAETVSRLGGHDAEVPPGGGMLSPGERQLIALARVYLSAAQVVILDEATCHLDPVAEARAEEAFAERHGTLIVIAHRISSAMRADRVLVMDGADAVLGSHHDLLTSNNLYADLVGYWDRA
ncbi:MAG: ABC transporter ATP-binding protein, partial [Actinomycetes bacterium]